MSLLQLLFSAMTSVPPSEGTFTVEGPTGPLNINGYDDDTSLGAISGDTTIRGLVINEATSSDTENFRIVLEAASDPGQDHFTEITVADADNEDETFLTVNADSYLFFSGVAVWEWGDGSSRLWLTNTDGVDRDFTAF